MENYINNNSENFCDAEDSYFLSDKFIDLCKDKLAGEPLAELIEEDEKNNKLIKIEIPKNAREWNTKVHCTCGMWILKTNMPTHTKTQKCITLSRERKSNTDIIPYLEYLLKISASDACPSDKEYICSVVKRKIETILK